MYEIRRDYRVISSIASVPTPSISSTLKVGLISFWELENTSWIDSQGSNTLAPTVNPPAIVPGKVGNGGDFDDTNNTSLSIATNASLEPTATSFSIAAWVNLASKPTHVGGIATKWTGSGDVAYRLFWDNALDDFCMQAFTTGGADAGQAQGTTTPSISTYYYVIGEVDIGNSLVGITINNGSTVTVPLTGPVNAGGNFNIGIQDFSTGFDGIIDQIGFWKKLLTPAEKTQLYNGGNGLSYAAM